MPAIPGRQQRGIEKNGRYGGEVLQRLPDLAPFSALPIPFEPPKVLLRPPALVLGRGGDRRWP